MDTVTICIPTITRRANMLGEAVQSVVNQHHPCQLSIYIDHNREGTWTARNKAIEQVLNQPTKPDWIGFLDDDDLLLPHHTAYLLSIAKLKGADMVWGWFEVLGGFDPFTASRGKQFDLDNPHIFPIAYIARTYAIEYAMQQGGFQPERGGGWGSQDYPVIKSIWEATNGKFYAVPEITWTWRHHASNTSGLPTR